MKKLIKEEIGVLKTNFKDYDVFYIKSDTKEEKDLIYNQRSILSKFGAKFNTTNKIWFWFVDKENPQKTIDKIKLALAELNQAIANQPAKNTPDDKQNLIIDIDKVIDAIKTENPSKNPEVNITPQDEEQIKNKLEAFKQMLVNIENDEDFKNAMKQIIDFKAAQGYEFSLLNALLIIIQNPRATIVNSKSNWESKYSRTVNPNAKSLMIWAPSGARFSKPKDKIEQEKKDFYNKIGKKQGQPLTPNEKFKLDKISQPNIQATRFKLVPVYDAADTTQIEGTEDYIKKGLDSRKDMKWFEDNLISDEVKPIYSALVEFTVENNIELEVIDDLDGARGSSSSGKIQILKNEGNDVGLTKTLAHEITHELLHQKYLAQKNTDVSKFHIGKLSRETVEQQAELSAWMFMYAFGFDIKTTSLNYTIMWGGNKENMVQVFDTVSKVVNFLINYVNKKIAKPIDEEQGNNKHGNLISPHDIAQLLGVENMYNKLTHQQLHERIIKKLS